MSLEHHAWTTVRPVETCKALWVDRDNARAVAETFGGTVREVSAFGGRPVTRIDLGNRSRPVGFWITENGRILDDDQWEEVEDL